MPNEVSSRQDNQRTGEAQKYFESLPAYVQENIMQTGVSLNTKEDLEHCAENMTKKGFH